MGQVSMRESWTRLGAKEIHAWHAAREDSSDALVVLLPGLGLPAYAAPTVRAIAAAGAACALLDLPGFGEAGPLGARPHIEDIGKAAAAWVRRHHRRGRLVMAGHSTGAQAALTAALAIQAEWPEAELVLAGPTFMPPQRRLGPLLMSTPRAYQDDSVRELRVLPAVGRGGLGVWSMLRSGMRDAPERRIADLRLGVTLTAGRRDAFAPGWWLQLLRASARQAAYARVVQAPGSHNNLFTHPDEVAAVILRAAIPEDG
jgi:alpha-beta hydrolase superfamily lysophospholipase